MSTKTDPVLFLLLTLVPALPEEIRREHFFPGIYDTVLSVIAEHGSDEQREWSDLAQIVRQDQALLRRRPYSSLPRS